MLKCFFFQLYNHLWPVHTGYQIQFIYVYVAWFRSMLSLQLPSTRVMVRLTLDPTVDLCKVVISFSPLWYASLDEGMLLFFIKMKTHQNFTMSADTFNIVYLSHLVLYIRSFFRKVQCIVFLAWILNLDASPKRENTVYSRKGYVPISAVFFLSAYKDMIYDRHVYFWQHCSFS